MTSFKKKKEKKKKPKEGTHTQKKNKEENVITGLVKALFPANIRLDEDVLKTS